MNAFIMADSCNAPDPNSISIKAWKPDGSTYEMDQNKYGNDFEKNQILWEFKPHRARLILRPT